MNLEEIEGLFETLRHENEKLESGTLVAGTRARKALAQIAKVSKALRVEVLATQANIRNNK